MGENSPNLVTLLREVNFPLFSRTFLWLAFGATTSGIKNRFISVR
jgi:hypothetical protein